MAGKNIVNLAPVLASVVNKPTPVVIVKSKPIIATN
jgi:hypothetical protein